MSYDKIWHIIITHYCNIFSKMEAYHRRGHADFLLDELAKDVFPNN